MSESIRDVAARAITGRLEGSAAVYLGCTELPPVFPAPRRAGMFECEGIHYVNPAALHIRAAFDRTIEES